MDELERLKARAAYLDALNQELRASVKRLRREIDEEDRLWKELVACVRIPRNEGEGDFDFLKRALTAPPNPVF